MWTTRSAMHWPEGTWQKSRGGFECLLLCWAVWPTSRLEINGRMWWTLFHFLLCCHPRAEKKKTNLMTYGACTCTEVVIQNHLTSPWPPPPWINFSGKQHQAEMPCERKGIKQQKVLIFKHLSRMVICIFKFYSIFCKTAFKNSNQPTCASWTWPQRP